jgi:hypothetical protein
MPAYTAAVTTSTALVAARPTRRRRWLAVVVGALTFGGVFAAAGSWIGWQHQSPAPTRDEALAVLRLAAPGVPVDSLGWHDDTRDVHQVRRPTARNLPGQQQASLDDGASRTVFDAARARLVAAGWRVRGTGDEFVASRGDLVTEWAFSPAGTSSTPAGDSVEVWLWRFAPTGVQRSIVAGWLLGGAVGAGVVWSVSRLPRGRGRDLLTRAGVLGAVALGPSTAFCLVATANNLLELPLADGQPVALWYCYFPFLLAAGMDMG